MANTKFGAVCGKRNARPVDVSNVIATIHETLEPALTRCRTALFREPTKIKQAADVSLWLSIDLGSDIH